MGNHLRSGSCLQSLVMRALPLLKEAERMCPRTGPGAKPEYSATKELADHMIDTMYNYINLLISLANL